jgi:hypothetical protein
VFTAAWLGILQGQNAPPAEVASVKPHPPDDNTQWMIVPQPGGRVACGSHPSGWWPSRSCCSWIRSSAPHPGQRPDIYDILAKVLDSFVRVLSSLSGRVVVNRTGLSGNWDLDLDFTPEPPTRNAGPSGQ